MALPPGITPKTVTLGIASFADGSLATGRATISMPVNVLHTPTNRPIFSSSITQQFVDGAATFDLLPTDAPGLNRVDWAYKLKVEIQGADVQPEVIYFVLPTAGPDVVDLDGLVTVPSSAGIPISVDVLTVDELDPLTAGFVADTDSQTGVALRAASGSQATDPTSPLRQGLGGVFATQRIMRPNGNRLGVLGDSLQSYGISATSTSLVSTNGPTIWNQVGVLTGQRIRMTDPMQVPGATVEDVLATQLPALLARATLPNACVVAIGRNNTPTSASWDLDAFMAKFESVCLQLADAGIVPMPATMMPTGAPGAPTAGVTANLLRVNAAIRKTCAQQGWILVDQYAALVDIAGGIAAPYSLSTAATPDIVHLTRAGYQAVADWIIAQGIPALFPPAPIYTVQDTADPFDLLAGTGLFLDTTGWSVTGTGGSVTYVTAAAGSGIRGKRARSLKTAGTATDTAFRKTLAVGAITPGHVYEFATNVAGEGLAASGATAQIALEWRTGGTTSATDLLLNQWARDERGTAYGTYPAPAGVDNVRLVAYTKGTPTIDTAVLLDGVTYRDRTALGVA